MANKILGIGVGTLVALLVIAPLSFVKGLLGKIPVIGKYLVMIADILGIPVKFVGRYIKPIGGLYA